MGMDGRLYLSPLAESMEEYALREVNGAKAAGGAGLPKLKENLASAEGSPLYQYVKEVESGISAISTGAKAGDSAAVIAAAGSIKKAGESFLSQANAPVIFN